MDGIVPIIYLLLYTLSVIGGVSILISIIYLFKRRNQLSNQLAKLSLIVLAIALVLYLLSRDTIIGYGNTIYGVGALLVISLGVLMYTAKKINND